MQPLVVLNVVGLTPKFVGEHTPNPARLAQRWAMRPLATVTPAVTCTVQATMLTGGLPRDHGIVANGWYFRDLAEIWFWRQSNRLVAGEKVWEAARKRDPRITCANLFWWYNMYSTADIGVTPRPMYPADGRKIPDCYTAPPALRAELTERLGYFPLFRFWGPATDITSSEWITRCALHVRATRRPALCLIYLPHLDYNLQRLGPDDPSLGADLAAVDALCGEIIAQAERDGARMIVLSEYGVTRVRTPIHINRALRQAGFIQVREELGHEQLDPGASTAFAVADHQIAHVYVRDTTIAGEVKALIETLDGVEHVLDADGKRDLALDHPRAGELVALARPDSWFTYYYWLDDDRAPDYARTVDIHRKPGYDPVELFLDPVLRAPKFAVAWRVLKQKAGLRTLMDVIPLDATLVRGSHGRVTDDATAGPVFITSDASLLPAEPITAQGMKNVMLRHLFADDRFTSEAVLEAVHAG